MSFGLSKNDPGICDAIETVQKSRNNQIIFLASAGNSNTSDESFPARHHAVISVYATNRYGTFLESNSASTARGAYMLGTYGDDIPGPLQEEFRTTYPGICKPGCSVATAVMAAISATMLAYACVLPSLLPSSLMSTLEHTLWHIWTTKGMEAVLDKMTLPDSDNERKRAVSPIWFGKNNPDENARWFALYGALSHIAKNHPRPTGAVC